MKKLSYLLGIAIIFIAYSCSSTYNAGSNQTDDVYYSSKNQPATPPPSSTPASVTPPVAPATQTQDNYNSNDNNNNQDYSSESPSEYTQNDDYVQSQSTDGQGNTYVTNNYNGDYYDYEYSSRIRRFYSPVNGYSYYDPYYTNSYWYDYNPSSWGLSIYLGYNWWAPSAFYYNPFCYGSFSVGYGYSPYWGYNPYGHHGGYYSGYNHGYWNGYSHGYADGYYGGNPNPYYFNSYDATSYHYGPRGSSGSNSPRSGSQRRSTVAPLSAKYEQAVAEGRLPKSAINPARNTDNSNVGRQNTGTGIRNQTGTGKSKLEKGKNSGTRNNTNSNPSINQGNRSNDNGGLKNNNRQNQNNGTRNTPDVKTRDRNYTPQNRNLDKNENQRPDIYNPTPELEKNSRQKDNHIEIPRQENKTPVFTPRDEPKQYRQDSPPPQQRSQPSQQSQPSRQQDNNNNNGGGRKR